MEIYAHEEGGSEELLRCRGCGSADLSPRKGMEPAGAPSWRMMSRLTAACDACGAVSSFSWNGRVRFRFVRRVRRTEDAGRV